MDAAKASVKKFISRDGKHDTSIHETVAPAVQNETVAAEQHDHSTTAVDREVHQDHYHTSEQPVYDQERLREQHHHNLLPTQERSYEHDSPDQVKQRLAQEAGKYRNTSTRVEGEHTTSAAPTVAGEHVHHHVHENIQPVVQKQTIEPHVVHTTQPVHEVHHNAAQHHSASALPAVSMDEFKRKGGSLTGREERRDMFEGCPPEQIAGHQPHNGRSMAGYTGKSERRGSSSSSSSSDGEGGRMSRRTKGLRNTPGVSATGGTVGSSDINSGSGGYQTHKKPGLMDKLNPKKDADGDGQPGFMK